MHRMYSYLFGLHQHDVIKQYAYIHMTFKIVSWDAAASSHSYQLLIKHNNIMQSLNYHLILK